MPIYKRTGTGVLALAAALACGGTFSAADNQARAQAPVSASRPDARATVSTTPAASGPSSQDTAFATADTGSGSNASASPALDPWSNATAAFRFGYNAYKSGDTRSAIEALAFAAQSGHPAALWKLGRMYQTGDGVPKDAQRAFTLFLRIANEYADGNPRGANARFVASAFVTLGEYYVDGFPGMDANEGLARRYFAYAASYYGDPEAQFRLATMYLVGQGGAKNTVQAARWFKLAAQKGHAGAQAEFGRLLFEGAGGFARSPVKGLMWLSIANASDGDDPHIRYVHDQAFALADEKQRRKASALVQEWQASKR